MPRFLLILMALKLAFLTACLSIFVSCGNSERGVAESTPIPLSTRVVESDTPEHATSDPYTGDLEIFESPERDKNLQIDRVMDILSISDGKSVADIGAGSGWFTVRAAKRVGTNGKVLAVEINKQYIDHINDRAKEEKLGNIVTILGKEDDPLLPPDSVDAVLILKTYHEIAEPIKLMKKVRVALHINALVGIIDRNGNGADHGLDKETVVKEMAQAGFYLKDQFDFVKPDGMDYFLVFDIKN